MKAVFAALLAISIPTSVLAQPASRPTPREACQYGGKQFSNNARICVGPSVNQTCSNGSWTDPFNLASEQARRDGVPDMCKDFKPEAIR